MSTTGRYHARIMDAQSVDETLSTVLGPSILSQVQEGVFYTIFGPNTTAGVVTIEGAHATDYTGTWSNIATITWATTDTVHRTNYTGAHLAIRARISTVISGGTVSVEFLGN